MRPLQDNLLSNICGQRNPPRQLWGMYLKVLFLSMGSMKVIFENASEISLENLKMANGQANQPCQLLGTIFKH